ncbi:hypothetical protein ELUMI_v1c07030 [Williamsoniiplasma luminosum]|uniref:Lipoprotein n=1 Tax=Williamsoniiplasma luminosum TaxID=214888 RepID=A0A2K8NU96_9MOLU|nr:hypothetical protein [Williamsoniiplasma luminosum]ATZ17425.1 hypothetical protein ELUMI_v1c07030 [Williamsoniiplasma luminosum]
MKKLLMILTSIGIMGATTSMVVSCDQPTKLDGLKAEIKAAQKILKNSKSKSLADIQALREMIELSQMLVDAGDLSKEHVEVIKLGLKLTIELFQHHQD